MHVLLRHARRVMLGVAAGALLFAAGVAHAGGEEVLTICIGRKNQENNFGKRFCTTPNRAITWLQDGVSGPLDRRAPGSCKGRAGPTGPSG